MSDSESQFGSEPNAFDGDSSDGQIGTESASLSWESAEAEVEVVVQKTKAVPSMGREEMRPTAEAVPLAIVPCGVDCASTSQYCEFLMNDTHRPERHVSYQSEASTSGRVDAAAEASSTPIVTVVRPGNPRMPMGEPQDVLFGVDYLGPNHITERELNKYRAEFKIPDTVKWRIPTPTESLSRPKDGEVVFFTDILKLGVRLPLQPAVQNILAHLGYAPGQYNPNFWVALMATIVAFGIAEEGEPSYEQFSYLYSVTKSKSADHGGWVQANCLQASARGHFINWVPTSQKTWRNRRVMISGHWEAPPNRHLIFRIPTMFQMAGRALGCRSVVSRGLIFHADSYIFSFAGKIKQPRPTKADIKKVERVRSKVPASARAYPEFLFTENLIKAKLVDPAESKCRLFYRPFMSSFVLITFL